MSQSLFDSKLINNTRAASQNLKSAEYTYKDARDLVVLAVGYVYLQAIADEARIQTAEAQVETAKALYDQATDQVNAGTSPAIDGLRAKSGTPDPATAVDSSKEQFRHPEADRCARDRPGSRAGIRTHRQVALPPVRGHHH